MIKILDAFIITFFYFLASFIVQFLVVLVFGPNVFEQLMTNALTELLAFLPFGLVAFLLVMKLKVAKKNFTFLTSLGSKLKFWLSWVLVTAPFVYGAVAYIDYAHPQFRTTLDYVLLMTAASIVIDTVALFYLQRFAYNKFAKPE